MIDLDGCEAAKPGKKLSDKATIFYKQFGNDAIKALSNNNSQGANKFKALYILAQRRMENSFKMDPPGNNPFNIKGQGDAGTISLTTTEYVKGEKTSVSQNFAKFSTVEKGFAGYLNLLENNFEKAYKALFDDKKTVSDFAEGLQKGRLGAYATDPDYKTKFTSFLKSVIKDYELMLNTEMEENYKKIDVLNTRLGDIDNSLSDKAKSIQKRIDKLENANRRIENDKQQLQEFKKNEGFN
jgi:flagellum-specific peptidoglycan hydrolase FlgJ